MEIYKKVTNEADVIFRCSDEHWAKSIKEAHTNPNAPCPMPYNHLIWSDPSAYGYVNESSTEEQVQAAWEAQARAFLPSSPEPIAIIVKSCAKAMRMGASPMPFLVHQITV